MIGLVKPIVKKFHKEENLQANISTVELVRGMHPKGKIGRRTKKYYTKEDLKKIKPSELLVRGTEEEEEVAAEEEDAPPDNALDFN